MAALFAWLQGTQVAMTVRESTLLTASLSAVHLLGLTLITGGALVANLRMLGVLLSERPVVEVARPAGRGVAIGLAISIATGLLLFAPRAPVASANRIFQTKMLLLAAATIFHFSMHRTASRDSSFGAVAQRATGATGLLLWSGVAVAGAAYILLE